MERARGWYQAWSRLELSVWLYLLNISLWVRGPAGVPLYYFRPRTDVSKAVCCSVMSKLSGFVVKLPALDSLLGV